MDFVLRESRSKPKSRLHWFPEAVGPTSDRNARSCSMNPNEIILKMILKMITRSRDDFAVRRLKTLGNNLQAVPVAGKTNIVHV